MYDFFVWLLLASVKSLIYVYFVSLAQGAFDSSSNATRTIRILRFLYISIRRCFLSNHFILGQCLHNVLSPEMLFNFCQNNCNEITPMSFISRYFMSRVKWDWPDTELKIFHFPRNEISSKHPPSVNTLWKAKFSNETQSILSKYLLSSGFERYKG